MPRSQVSKKKLFREFAKQPKTYVKRNYLKNLKSVKEKYKLRTGYKHFDRLTPSDTFEDHLFRDETKHNYRVRYAITQKARLLVQDIYRDLEK